MDRDFFYTEMPQMTPPPPPKPPRRRGIVAWLLIGMLLGGLVGGGLGSYFVYDHLSAQLEARIEALNTQSRGTSVIAPAALSTLTEGDIPALVDRVAPSVVQITAHGSTQTFFGNFNQQSTGSGVIVSNSGGNSYILTNYHVVENADTGFVIVEVDAPQLNEQIRGEVVGTDVGNDLAMIRVNIANIDNWPNAAPLGDSSQVRVGELAIAIGYPFGMDRTVTAGIISGLGREMQAVNGRTIRNMVQTDAAINPGNSGGPLFNARGEVIGINTAIESPISGSVGIGYAVAINTAKAELADLQQGQVGHPWIGIGGNKVEDLLQQIKDLPGLPESFLEAARRNLPEQGIIVSQIYSGSPAAEAGLRAYTTDAEGLPHFDGDVIVAVDGNRIVEFEDLTGYLENKQVGDQVNLTVIREGRSRLVPLTLGAWPAEL